MSSNMTEGQFPLYPQAVWLPVLAFPSWILCISPMLWHLSQRNIAAGSLIFWIILLNFFNSINPLIWPRDNIDEWYNGSGLCDIEVRIQVGASVALAACTAIIARRLANVMDTRNITVVPSKRSVLIEKALEIGFCWVYPIILMITYYIVQPFRYYIFGISGMSNVVNVGLLGFRLFHYRREFHNLIAARNTTKSRFVRLFLMALYVSIILVPYSFFILYQLADTIVDEYSWSRVHGPNWNSVTKVPANGVVRWDRWGEVAAGYIAFVLFGTGTDAHNTYRGILTSVGFGKLFPSLYIMSDSSGVQTPTSVTFVKRWTSSWSSKAKSLISGNGSVSEPSRNASFTGSVVQSVFTNPELVSARQQHDIPRNNTLSFFRRIFNRRTTDHSLLPVHRNMSTDTERLPVLDRTPSNPSAFTARAWAADKNTGVKAEEVPGVHVVREVHQASQDRIGEKKTGDDAWV
ncbi:hypothetical protein PMIN04_011057 [Paraphaeosphaeria minitans]